MSTDQVVISEGVALDVRSVSPVVLALGWLLDVMTTVALMAALSALLFGTLGSVWDSSAQNAIEIGIAVIVILIAPTAVETLTRGRSLGKLATGVQIVRDDGGPIRLRHAFVRALTGTVELWGTMGIVAFIVSLSNSKGRRLGDLLAGTYPARIRGAEKPLPPLYMPPALASWAAMADIRPLPDGMALEARQFVGRAPGLSPEVRAHLGAEYAARLEGYVSPPPPPGTPPEDFLAAVLATRRDREYALGVTAERRATTLTAALTRLPHQQPLRSG